MQVVTAFWRACKPHTEVNKTLAIKSQLSSRSPFRVAMRDFLRKLYKRVALCVQKTTTNEEAVTVACRYLFAETFRERLRRKLSPFKPQPVASKAKFSKTRTQKSLPGIAPGSGRFVGQIP